jgi:hypothetical protein
VDCQKYEQFDGFLHRTSTAQPKITLQFYTHLNLEFTNKLIITIWVFSKHIRHPMSL